jgi:hypothetical protein
MTDASWPDVARPGVPLNPERDGAHRLAFPNAEHDWIWRAGPSPFWVTHTGRLVVDYEMPSFRACYLGPCLTPAEVVVQVAAARREGIEIARTELARLDKRSPRSKDGNRVFVDVRDWEAIRALLENQA